MLGYPVRCEIEGEPYVFAVEVSHRNFGDNSFVQSFSYEIESGIVRGRRAKDSPIRRNVIHAEDAEMIDALRDFARERGEPHPRSFVFAPFARRAGYRDYFQARNSAQR